MKRGYLLVWLFFLLYIFIVQHSNDFLTASSCMYLMCFNHIHPHFTIRSPSSTYSAPRQSHFYLNKSCPPPLPSPPPLFSAWEKTHRISLSWSSFSCWSPVPQTVWQSSSLCRLKPPCTHTLLFCVLSSPGHLDWFHNWLPWASALSRVCRGVLLLLLHTLEWYSWAIWQLQL